MKTTVMYQMEASTSLDAKSPNWFTWMTWKPLRDLKKRVRNFQRIHPHWRTRIVRVTTTREVLP